MKYKTHIVGGAALGYFVYNNIDMFSSYINDSPTLMIATTGLVFGSLIPDIDIQTGYLSRRVKPLSFFTSKLFKHRGYTHSILGVISFSMLLFIAMRALRFSSATTHLFSISFAIGMISHVLLDLMTWNGVTLFFPYDKRIHLGNLRSNMMSSPGSEFLIAFALMIIAYKNLLELI